MLVLFSGVALAGYAESNMNAADTAMDPPNPVENKVYDAMIGTWQGTCEMMGKKMREVIKARWGLHHQFMIVDVKATGVEQPKMKYESMEIFGVDKEGKAKTFWFDNGGADGVSTSSGTFSDNKLELNDSNATFKEVRTFEIKGKEMVVHAKGSASWQGKETPFDVRAVYKKK